MKWFKVVPLSELPEGERRVVAVEGRSIALLHHKGKIYAFNSVCPHMKGPLHKGQISDDGAIVCPWHRSAFDLRTGDVKDWAPWPPGVGKVLGAISRKKVLHIYPIRVEDGHIWVGVEEGE